MRIWTAGGVAMRLICQVHTAKPYEGYSPADAQLDDDDWPPFRKVSNCVRICYCTVGAQAGMYDPFSDDPRVAVQRVLLCAQTGTLVAGGAAGQTTVYRLCDGGAHPIMLIIHA